MSKKINFSLPEEGQKNKSNNFFIKLKNFCVMQKSRRKLKKGYLSMSEINLTIANMCINADNEAFSAYEEKLAECEKMC